ncbi:uncharacterized protein LOC144146501 [Haemaphysalis longicornis]
MTDTEENRNFSWIHFSPLETEPRYYLQRNAIYLPPMYYMRLLSMWNPLDDDAIPLELPLFTTPLVNIMSVLFTQPGPYDVLQVGSFGAPSTLLFVKVWVKRLQATGFGKVLDCKSHQETATD